MSGNKSDKSTDGLTDRLNADIPMDETVSMAVARADIAIVGTGPVGLITAVALAQNSHHSITLFGPRLSDKQLSKDTRTTAFMEPSLIMLKNCGIWEHCKANAAPLKHLRMIDDCGSLIRAPDCYFSATELDMDAFAENIPNSDLNRALINIIKGLDQIKWVETQEVTQVSPALGDVTITTVEGETYQSFLCIGADGRNSICRDAAGIEAKRWDYDQTAIACSFTHSTAHNATSTEIHRQSGPMTLIPLEENRSSLVWSLKPADAQEILSLDDQEFSNALYDHSHAILGEITSVGKRVCFPIKGLRLDQFAANRIALVGEAAHVVPPIGAQGMNLGLRDAAHLVEIVRHETTLDTDLEQLSTAYTQARKQDIWSRTMAIDILNKSLLLPFLPLKYLRSTGLGLLRSYKPLRQYIMKQGLGSQSTLPPLMEVSPLMTQSQAGSNLKRA